MMGSILPAVPDGPAPVAGRQAVARGVRGTVGRNVVGQTRKRGRGERGAAAVEFALVAPLLFALVFGIIDFGWAINRYAVISNAAREGVRMASIGSAGTDVSSAVTAALSDIGGDGTTTVTVTCEKPDLTSCAYASAVPGDTAIVTVEYRVGWLTPVGSMFAGDMTLRKASRMRIE
jgi:Flp pilus assembly protein TadG